MYDATVEEEGGRGADAGDVDAPDDDQDQRNDACPARRDDRSQPNKPDNHGQLAEMMRYT